MAKPRIYQIANLESNLTSYVLKTGDVMTGQLNVADGGLIVQSDDSEAAVFFRSPTGTIRIRPHYNQEGSNKGSWFETITTTGSSYSKFTLSASDIIFEPTGNVGVGNNAPVSKFTVAGRVESTTGGFRFPDGTTQTTAAASVTGVPSLNIVTSNTVTAIAAQHYVLTNTAQTIVTLAASPASGDVVYISARNNLSNNLIVPNGNKFESNTSNVMLDLAPYSVQLRYINANLGWILI